jgi:hypothetical protein
LVLVAEKAEGVQGNVEALIRSDQPEADKGFRVLGKIQLGKRLRSLMRQGEHTVIISVVHHHDLFRSSSVAAEEVSPDLRAVANAQVRATGED